MNATLMNKEKTAVTFSFEVSAEVLETGLAFAYNKHKNEIALPGFRKGKVPRKIVEKQFGEKANPLYERLARYFQILESYRFITFK